MVKKYKGKLIKTIGDATMIYFQGKSLDRAINFAREFQSYEIPVTNNKILEFRIGIAYGILEKEKVYIQKITNHYLNHQVVIRMMVSSDSHYVDRISYVQQ